MSIQSTLDESAGGMENRIRAVGEEQVYRERITEMARNGDLYLISRLFKRFSYQHLDSVLSPVSSELCALERGSLIGLRNFWWNLLRYGDESLPQEMPEAERNKFVEMTELDRS